VPDPAVRLTPRELAGVRLACLGRLTAGILHEFRNPLAIVQGNLEFLAAFTITGSAPITPGDLQQPVSDARAGGTDLLLLCEQLRQFVHADPAPARCNLDKTLAAAVALTRPHWKRRCREITISRERTTVRQVAVNPGDLLFIIAALLHNAALALPAAGGSISIGISAERKQLACTISDNGCGISPAVLRRLGRCAVSTRAPADGRGESALAAACLLRRAGGALAFASARGQGTSVRLLLPR